MKLIDEQYTRRPIFGILKMTQWLRVQGHHVNHKRVGRLMKLMGIEAIYPKPRLSQRNTEHKIYPYLLRDLEIERADQVWTSDITYIRLRQGFIYLVAIMDWYSRYVLSWSVSNTMDVSFCIEALQEAFRTGQPEIFNSDQGSQYTSQDFTKILLDREIKISMDGKGRCFDKTFVSYYTS